MAHRVRRQRLVAPFPHSCAAAAACEGSESGTRPFERGAECGECGGIDSQGQFAYSSSKAALIHLTREWAHTFLPLGVRVNCIAPSVFPNEISVGRFDEDRRSRQEEELWRKIPAGESCFIAVGGCALRTGVS